MNSLILRTATRLLVGLILVFSVYLLLRGHNEPGGGFSGALVAATGFALFTISEGPCAVRRALRIAPFHLIVMGLVTALVAGIAGMAAGKPFLTGLWGYWGSHSNALAVGTPLLFDVGVFLVVLGTVLALLLALEESAPAEPPAGAED